MGRLVKSLMKWTGHVGRMIDSGLPRMGWYYVLQENRMMKTGIRSLGTSGEQVWRIRTLAEEVGQGILRCHTTCSKHVLRCDIITRLSVIALRNQMVPLFGSNMADPSVGLLYS